MTDTLKPCPFCGSTDIKPQAVTMYEIQWFTDSFNTKNEDTIAIVLKEIIKHCKEQL